MTQTRSRAIVGIFALITLLFIIFLIFAFYTISSLRSTSKNIENGMFDNTEAPIAVISIKGVIMDSKKAIESLFLAEKNKNIKAIILRIDSPGGAVGPTQEIYEEIRRIDQKIPVYASFGTVAASGGYYLGAATRKIYTNAGTLTGSIGVIMQFADMSKLYEFVKIKPQVIKAGKYKDIGSPSREMTAEEKALMDNMITKVHLQFIKDIMVTRKDRIKGDVMEHAQGQIFSGEEAMELGLVDEVAGLWEAGRRIHKDLKLKGEFDMQFIKLKKKFSFTEFFEGMEEAEERLKNLFQAQTTAPLFLYQPK